VAARRPYRGFGGPRRGVFSTAGHHLSRGDLVSVVTNELRRRA
jgi:hypothetical protein